jgi:hypothetical protein
MDTKFAVAAGSACGETLVTAAMMRGMISGVLCVCVWLFCTLFNEQIIHYQWLPACVSSTFDCVPTIHYHLLGHAQV